MTFRVGLPPTQEMFTVHHNLLTTSVFFQAAIEKRETLKQEALILLPSCTPENFKCYQHYLYTNNLACRDKLHRIGGPPQSISDTYDELVDLDLLGVRIRDSGFTDVVISAILQTYEDACLDQTLTPKFRLPNKNVIKKIYQATNLQPPLRRVFIDMFIWQANPGRISTQSEYPVGFLFELVQACLGKLGVPEGRNAFLAGISCCDYHDHEKSGECNSRKRKREGEGEQQSGTSSRTPGVQVRRKANAEDGDSDDDLTDDEESEDDESEDERERAIEAMQAQIRNMQSMIGSLTGGKPYP